MRVREWYGWHFPEMTKIVADNIAYAKAVSVDTCVRARVYLRSFKGGASSGVVCGRRGCVILFPLCLPAPSRPFRPSALSPDPLTSPCQNRAPSDQGHGHARPRGGPRLFGRA